MDYVVPRKPKDPEPKRGKEAVTDAAREFGKRLLDRMTELGLKDETLGPKVGLSALSVRNLTRGENTVQYLKLGELARALGTTPNFLLGFSAGARCGKLAEAGLEGLLEAWPFSEEEIHHLPAILRRAIEGLPASARADMSQEDLLRIQLSFAAKQLLRSKPS